MLQDVLTLHGSQFRNVDLIVASPPCQAYSYRAMPWSRAKALPPPDNSLFEACFRIQREAIEAAGHHIPLVVENVRGAQKWVGRSRWNFGSFHLWGDVPALMPMTPRLVKVPIQSWSDYGKPGYKAQGFNVAANQMVAGRKNSGGSWFNVAHNTTSGHSRNPVTELAGRKMPDYGLAHSDRQRSNALQSYDVLRASLEDGIKQGGDWFNSEQPSISRKTGSRSKARKAASALIAKIPLVLARHIGAYWKPMDAAA